MSEITKEERLTVRNIAGDAALKSPVVCGRCNETEWRPITANGEDIAARLAAYEETYPANGWISVDDHLPKCEEEVFVLCVSSSGRKTVTIAMYEDGKMPKEDSGWYWYGNDFAYDEEIDDYLIPQGWWECCYYGTDDVTDSRIDDKVLFWMPLPSTTAVDAKIISAID